MSRLARILTGAVGALVISLPGVSDAISVSTQSLTPGTTVQAKNLITFKITTDFDSPFLTVTDSFPKTSFSSEMIAGGGNVSWVPNASDVGTHTFSITAKNLATNESANTTLTLTITPPPSASITGLTPGDAVMPGNAVAFTVLTPGITNPRFSIYDSFSGSSITNTNITSSGAFSWTPDVTQNGDHLIEVYAFDAAGKSVSASQKIRVGLGPTLALNPASSTIMVAPWSPVSFTAIPSSYTPTAFSVLDSFPGSSATNANINPTGVFAWTPNQNDIGVHTITITGMVGTYGEKASVTQKVVVLKLDGTMPPDTTTTAPVATLATTTAAAGTAPATGDLAALLSQLAALQAKLTSLKGGAATPQASSVAQTLTQRYVFSKFIGPGYESTEVRRLQERLVELGFMTVKPNGYFGPSTKAAVIKFQKAHGIDPRGHVGPATRAALNEE